MRGSTPSAVTLGQLRTFMALARTGSVQGAARTLGVTPPAVSAALAILRDELGVELVRRIGRGIELTPAGHCYADHARQVLALLDEGAAAARAAADPTHGRVRIAAVTSAAEHLVPELLGTFLERWPQAQAHVEVGNRERVVDLLRAREADLAIAGRPPDDGALRSVATRDNTLVLVARPDLARRKAGAAALPWLMREPGSGTRVTAEALLESLQVDPVRLTLGPNGAVIAGAVVGLGVTLVAEETVSTQLANGQLARVDLPGLPLHRPWHLLVRTAPSPTARLFVRHVRATPGWHSPRNSPLGGSPTPRVPA